MKRLALLAIICIAGAQASLFADEIEARDGTQSGDGAFLWLQADSNDPNLQISFNAEHLAVVSTSYSSKILVLPGEDIGMDTYFVQITPETADKTALETYQNVTGVLDVAQSGAAIAMAGAGELDSIFGLVKIQSMASPTFDYGTGISNGANAASSRNTFTPRDFGTPLVVSETNSGNVEITFQGDLVMEMERLDFAIQSNAGASRIETSDDTDYSPGVTDYKYRFARLTFSQVSMTISSSDFTGIVQAASTETELSSEIAIQLSSATGTYRGLDLKDQDVTIPAGEFMLVPSGNDVSISEPGDEEAKPLGFMALASSPQLFWLATPLVLLPFLRRRATLGRMENAIESGKFYQASKVAKRILRKSPEEERATMGYVVAQSKMGLHNSVVNHLQRWLKSKKPSDGVFNYVLGLSYMELGETAVAAEQFAAAVILTPSLREVIPSVPLVGEHAYA
jgi:hypothetical protein